MKVLAENWRGREERRREKGGEGGRWLSEEEEERSRKWEQDGRENTKRVGLWKGRVRVTHSPPTPNAYFFALQPPHK